MLAQSQPLKRIQSLFRLLRLLTEARSWMALDDQLFAMVEDKGFRWLVNHLEPRFVIPNVCLPAKYTMIATRLQQLINGSESISFTKEKCCLSFYLHRHQTITIFLLISKYL